MSAIIRGLVLNIGSGMFSRKLLFSILIGSIYLPAHSTTLSPKDVENFIIESNRQQLRNGTNVWERIADGFSLNLDVDPKDIEAAEKLYSKKSKIFQNMASRANRYLFHIVNELEKRGMPSELALLPIVESSFNPVAVSQAGAMGLWQFIPSTGRSYGLQQDWLVDERRGIIESTTAALNYLQSLYEEFGDWALALASYNYGEGRVRKLMSQNKAAKKPQTYRAIRLPKETRQYVPRLLALRNIVRNPEKFNVTLDSIPNRPYFVPVKTDQSLPLQTIAQLSETSEAELIALNPAFNFPVYQHVEDRALLLPVANSKTFKENLESFDLDDFNVKVYIVQRNDSLQSIAEKLNISVNNLLSNNPSAYRQLSVGQALLVTPEENMNPGQLYELSDETIKSQISLAKKSRSQKIPAEPVYKTYTIKKGDTLFEIAKRFNIKESELIALNSIEDTRNLQIGDEIFISTK